MHVKSDKESQEFNRTAKHGRNAVSEVSQEFQHDQTAVDIGA